MTGPGDKAYSHYSWDPMYETRGKNPHAEEERRLYLVGDAFMASIEAIGTDMVFLAVFCEELTAAVCNEKPIDAAREVVLKAHKKRTA